MSAERTVFQTRCGENVAYYAEVLSAPPELELDPHAKERVLSFESGLFEGNTEHRQLNFILPNGERAGLKEITRLDSSTSRLAPAFFLTEEGERTVHEEELDYFIGVDSTTAAIEAITRYSFEDAHKMTKKVVGRSLQWVKGQYKSALLDEVSIQPIDEVLYVQNPQELAVKVRGLFAYSKFLRQVRRDLKTADQNEAEVGAKRAVVEIYQALVNDALAGLYPAFLEFNSQVAGLPEAYTHQWETWVAAEESTRLNDLITRQAINDRFARRLDGLRNGLSDDFLNKRGGYRSVSRALLDYMQEESQPDDLHGVNTVFTPDEVERLSRIRLNAENLKNLLEVTLAECGLLSENTYDLEKDKHRKGRAPDDKWQVNIDPSKDSLSVNGVKGVITVPASFDRSLTTVEPVGAIPVGAHEMQHVAQSENSRSNPYGLRLVREQSKGKRYVILRESGGIAQERLVHSRLFGQRRQNNLHYVHAMTTYEETGDELSAIRSFINSMLEQRQGNEPTPSEMSELVAKAVDRVRRLTRRYGGFNSQPLMYAEQALLNAEVSRLTPEIQHQIYAEGNLDLPDMVRLHRFGLLKPSIPSGKTLPDIFIEKSVEQMRQLLAAEA